MNLVHTMIFKPHQREVIDLVTYIGLTEVKSCDSSD